MLGFLKINVDVLSNIKIPRFGSSPNTWISKFHALQSDLAVQIRI